MADSSPSKVILYKMLWEDEDVAPWIGIQSQISVVELFNEDGALPSEMETEIIRGCASLTKLSTVIAEYSPPPISHSYTLLTELKLRFVKQSTTLAVAEIKDWQDVFQHLPMLKSLTLKRHPYARKGLTRHAINPILLSLSVLPSDPAICPLLRNLIYDITLKCDWAVLLAFSRSRSHVGCGGMVQSLLGNICAVSLARHDSFIRLKDVCRDVYYEELKSYEDIVRNTYWREWQGVPAAQ